MRFLQNLGSPVTRYLVGVNSVNDRWLGLVMKITLDMMKNGGCPVDSHHFGFVFDVNL